MGAVANMRPDLFKAVVAYVPFVDVVNTELDETLPLTAGEWEEWGNPVKSKENFLYMLSYSPYDNVAAKDYPAMLVKTSLNDSQVLFHGAGQVGRQAPLDEDGQEPAPLQDQHGRRPRRRLRSLRRPPRDGLRLRLHAHPDGRHAVAARSRRPSRGGSFLLTARAHVFHTAYAAFLRAA